MIFYKHRLQYVHPDLAKVVMKCGEILDIAVVCGNRSEVDQNHAFKQGKSKTKWPNSPHNRMPSLAVDLAPTLDKGRTIPWDKINLFKILAKEVLANAKELGIDIVWGGNWKTFKDYPHYELAIFSKEKRHA